MILCAAAKSIFKFMIQDVGLIQIISSLRVADIVYLYIHYMRHIIPLIVHSNLHPTPNCVVPETFAFALGCRCSSNAVPTCQGKTPSLVGTCSCDEQFGTKHESF